MDGSPYSFFAEPVDIRYDFDNVSDTRLVRKIVRLTETSLSNVFNLALPDLLDDSSESDISVTDNDNLRTVLATVMRIIDNFLTKFPEKIVTIRGSDERRTRLYRIVIGRELDAIKQRFDVTGQFGNGLLEDFKPDGNYKQFYIRLKI